MLSRSTPQFNFKGSPKGSNSPNWRRSSEPVLAVPQKPVEDKIKGVIEDIKKQKSASLSVLLTTPGLKQHFFNAPADEQYKVLVRAVEHNNFPAVELLVDHHFSKYNCQFDAWALRLAAKKGNFNILKKLSECGNFDVTSERQYALRVASAHGYSCIVKFLLENPRVDPSVGKQESLFNACQNGHFGTVYYLIRHKSVDPTVGSNKALRKALEGKYFRAIDELLTHPKMQSLPFAISELLKKNGYDIVSRKKNYVSPYLESLEDKIVPKEDPISSPRDTVSTPSELPSSPRETTVSSFQEESISSPRETVVKVTSASPKLPSSPHETKWRDAVIQSEVINENINRTIAELLEDDASTSDIDPPGLDNQISEYHNLLNHFKQGCEHRNMLWNHLIIELSYLCQTSFNVKHIYDNTNEKVLLNLTLLTLDYEREIFNDLLTHLCIKYMPIIQGLSVNNNHIIISRHWINF